MFCLNDKVLIYTKEKLVFLTFRPLLPPLCVWLSLFSGWAGVGRAGGHRPGPLLASNCAPRTAQQPNITRWLTDTWHNFPCLSMGPGGRTEIGAPPGFWWFLGVSQRSLLPLLPRTQGTGHGLPPPLAPAIHRWVASGAMGDRACMGAPACTKSSGSETTWP